MTPADPSPDATPRRGPGRPAGASTGAVREALLVAARALMAERGLPRVTVREVAERAGVQPALVNYYFGGKDGLLQAVVDDLTQRVYERVREAAAEPGPPEARLRAMLRAMARDMAEEPYAPRLMVEQVLFGSEDAADDFVDQYASRQLQVLAELFAEGQGEGTFRDVDIALLIPQMLGGVIWFFLSQPVLGRLFDIERVTPELAERFADQCADVLLRGIRVDAGSTP